MAIKGILKIRVATTEFTVFTTERNLVVNERKDFCPLFYQHTRFRVKAHVDCIPKTHIPCPHSCFIQMCLKLTFFKPYEKTTLKVFQMAERPKAPCQRIAETCWRNCFCSAQLHSGRK